MTEKNSHNNEIKKELSEILINEKRVPDVLHFATKIYERLIGKLIEKNITISTMESCTGGLIVSLLTDTEGASNAVIGSSVTYCNDEKIRCKVKKDTIEKYGVYSKQTADAMAKAVKKTQGSDIGVGVTGSFSNADPNNADSVPGEVYFSIAINDGTYSFLIKNIPNLSRHEAKLLTAYYVAEKILTFI